MRYDVRDFNEHAKLEQFPISLSFNQISLQNPAWREHTNHSSWKVVRSVMETASVQMELTPVLLARLAILPIL